MQIYTIMAPQVRTIFEDNFVNRRKYAERVSGCYMKDIQLSDNDILEPWDFLHMIIYNPTRHQ